MPLAVPKLRAQRLILAAASLALALAGVLAARLALADDSANYPAASLIAPTDPDALIARGKYLATAADCMPCHTGPGHAPYSGGLVIATPYGGLASPNITPDKATGIGNWSDKEFYNALHYGTAPGHSYLVFPEFLYPAMPYTSYTKLSYADVMAIKAYLFSLPPAQAPRTPSTMAFPFSQRPVLLGWRLLFFRPGPMQMDPSWDEHIKNGAYLTEALGHCGECHTPRNFLSASIVSRAYAGGAIDDLYAPNISSDKTQGVGGWAQADLVAYLHDGGNMVKGSPFGSMGDMVANSTSQLPVSDVADIAAYLQTATKPQQTTPPAAVADAAESIQRGAAVYTANCAACHGKTGAGLPPRFAPNLAGNSAIAADEPYNVMGPVLTGLAPWTKIPMPGFAARLSDQQIADVANYVRTAWGNQGVANATPEQVKHLRGIAKLPPSADKLSDELGCPRISPAGGADTVADPGNGLLGIYQDATPATLANRTRTLIAAVRANNSGISDADLTNMLVAAYCPVVAHAAGLSLPDKQEALRDFIAGAAPLIAAH